MKTEDHKLTKDDFDNMCPCGKFTPIEEVLSVCACGQERFVIFCESCGETHQIGGHIGCGAPDDMLRLVREGFPKVFG